MTDAPPPEPESDDLSDDEGVPSDAMEAFEALEFARAVRATTPSGGQG